MSQAELDALLAVAGEVAEPDAGLRELFDQLNAIYWNDSCGAEVVKWGDSSMPETLQGDYSVDSKTIRINPILRRNARGLVQSLIHEMCHFFDISHEDKFKAELKRLSAQGCDLAAEDLQMLENPVKIREECESLLDGWADAEGSVPSDLDRVYAYLCKRTGWEDNELHDELSGEALSQLIREANDRHSQ